MPVDTYDGSLTEEFRFPTTTPEETLGTATAWLRERGKPYRIGAVRLDLWGSHWDSKITERFLIRPRLVALIFH